MAAWATETRSTATDADAPVPTPAERRRAAATRYHDDPWQGVQYPAALLRDVDAYWRGWSLRVGGPVPSGLAAVAVAAYALGRRDESAEATALPDPAGGATGEDESFIRPFFAGFFLCLALVILGVVLVSLRAL